MAVKSMTLTRRNKLATDYLNGKLKKYFPYDPFGHNEERMKELQQRTFPREQLVDILTATNQKWGATQATLQQIERLRNENSVVVIGGQQAGLLSGPLYTIHKIISIIQFARQQEAKFNVPVIPIFWIAGEDHDYDEINHIYSMAENKLVK